MKTRQSLFGHIFGANLVSLVPGVLPSKTDVTRRWMHASDERLRQLGFPTKLTNKESDDIIREVSEDIINVWKNLERPTRSESDVDIVVKRIVEKEVMPLCKTSPTKASETWKQNILSRFSVQCDIGYLAPREINPPKRLIAEGDEEEPKPSSSKSAKIDEALYVPPSDSDSDSSQSNSDSDFETELLEEEGEKKFKCTANYYNAFCALQRMGASPREGINVLCCFLKDLGIDDPAMYPTIGWWIGFEKRVGEELIAKAKEANTGLLCIKFDSKNTEQLMPRSQKESKNILTMIKEPNEGSDAIVDFRITGKKGIDVGETVWQVLQENKSDKGSLGGMGSDAGESSPNVGPHPYVEIKLGYPLQRIFCELHTVSNLNYFYVLIFP